MRIRCKARHHKEVGEVGLLWRRRWQGGGGSSWGGVKAGVKQVCDGFPAMTVTTDEADDHIGDEWGEEAWDASRVLIGRR